MRHVIHWSVWIVTTCLLCVSSLVILLPLLPATPAHAASGPFTRLQAQAPQDAAAAEDIELRVLKQVAYDICPNHLNDDDDDPNPYMLGDDYYILNCSWGEGHTNSVHIQRFATPGDAKAQFGSGDEYEHSFPPSQHRFQEYTTEEHEEPQDNQRRHYWLAAHWIISSRAVDHTTPRQTMDPEDVSLVVYDAAQRYNMFADYITFLPIVLH
jgi:hypothetical protein